MAEELLMFKPVAVKDAYARAAKGEALRLYYIKSGYREPIAMLRKDIAGYAADIPTLREYDKGLWMDPTEIIWEAVTDVNLIRAHRLERAVKELAKIPYNNYVQGVERDEVWSDSGAAMQEDAELADRILREAGFTQEQINVLYDEARDEINELIGEDEEDE